MSLAISTSASSPVSTASSTSPAPPATPLTPSTTSSVAFNLPGDFNFDALRLPSQDSTQTSTAPAGANQAGPVRRKPSRRANTAERRATHNAVERQRRETLNGRFLDLAALLPNLASVRRPSKSAIVNSSIAVIHTQRRARCIAARELRLLKLEADALRAEVNEWRGRSGMASADEPLRSREFEELVSGGLEEAEENLIEEERRALEIVKEGLRLDASGLGADTLAGPFAFNMTGNNNMMFGLAEDDEEDSSDSHSAHIRPGSQGSVGSVPSLPMTIPVPRASTQVNTPTSAGPIIFDPTAALLQSHSSHTAGINAFGFDGSFDVNAHPAAQHLQFNDRSQEKLAAWNAQLSLLAVQQQQQQYAAQHNNGFYSDDGSISSSLGSNNGVDLHQMQQNALRSRSSSTIPTLATSPTRGTMTPPSSAPATATTYAEASGDVFNAAYGYGANGWKTHGKELMVGGGNGFGATMGLFM